MIPYNKPFIIGPELDYIEQAVRSGKISGDGMFTQKCHSFFENRYRFRKALLTTSCTDALEMAALMLDIQPGDEIIVPSYTFVSTAAAFALRGARIVFADSEAQTPNIDTSLLEELITTRTRAIVPVHYAGIACDMDAIQALAEKYALAVVEDAAQAIDSCYKGQPLGGLGTFGAFSFHETKNVISGEGGMLAVNDSRYCSRSEIVREKGTNRSAFFRGEIDKYGWVDLGSSFLPSEIIAAFLFAQLEQIETIQAKRKLLWEAYFRRITPLAEQGFLSLPYIPQYATNNGHMFYVVCNSPEDRDGLILHLKHAGIMAVFHYQPLHQSSYYHDKHDGRNLPHALKYSDCLLRLPLYYDLQLDEINIISDAVFSYFT